jgi:hypothetical protein
MFGILILSVDFDFGWSSALALHQGHQKYAASAAEEPT